MILLIHTLVHTHNNVMKEGKLTGESETQHIINTAIDLFAEKGISNVSVVTIAKAIGATTGKVYYYFRNGKSDIINEILQIFEDCVCINVPNTEAWEAKEASAEKIFFNLFFKFPDEDTIRLRKIIRIILSEMYFDEQIACHAVNNLIIGREKMLANCFNTFIRNGKVAPFEAESVARLLNRLLLVYAMEDALRYPYLNDEAKTKEQTAQMMRDCTSFISALLGKN